jgi:hypothetical protein
MDRKQNNRNVINHTTLQPQEEQNAVCVRVF